MSIFSALGISTAYAAGAAPAAAGSGMFSMLMISVVFIVLLYFITIRPQTKRSKEHRDLLGGLSVGDEIMTNAGILGKLTKMRDDYVSLMIAGNVEVLVQKNAIVKILPKGTIETLK